MRFMDEAKCHICKRIFCCAKCRQKHQIDTHAIAVTQPLSGEQTNMEDHGQNDGDGHGDHGGGDDRAHGKIVVVKPTTIYVFCPICEQKPLTLREGMYNELLSHIESAHLPLRCRKCLRQYTKIDDLLEFTRCANLAQNCSTASLEHNQTCDTDVSKVTVKKATAAATISTQTSPSIARDLNEMQQQQHLTPISLFNLRWKAKRSLTHEEFISDSVSSIRNLSTDSVNLSSQQRLSIGGQIAVQPGKGKLIRSTSTPLQVCSVFAKPKETLAFNATASGGPGGGYISSICHSGYVLDEHNTPAAAPVAMDNSVVIQQTQQRAWKVAGRPKMSAVTPLRQVMSKSIQKAFVEHGVGMLATNQAAGVDSSEGNAQDAGSALDLRLSPVVRRTQSGASMEAQSCQGIATTTKPYQILLSAQKMTTESIVITRTQKHGVSRNVAGFLPVSVSTTNASTTSTVYNSCESVEIITSSSSSSATTELTANIQLSNMPPITPITRIPGTNINKKLIKFETPHKNGAQTVDDMDESVQEGREIFYTPNPSTSPHPDVNSGGSSKERRRQQAKPRQLSGQFSPNRKTDEEQSSLLLPQRPQGPRARPPLRTCRNQQTFSCVQDVESDEEVFLPHGASTQNDRKCSTTSTVSQSEPGRLWSLMSSVMRLPSTLRADRSADKENTNTNSGSLIRRCASIAGSLVRTMHSQDDDDPDMLQPMKRKRTQTLDNQYSSQMSPASSSKRLRIQPRKPIERMRNNY